MLFVLAGTVALVTALSLLYRVKPEMSCSGIVITLAALLVMPILAWMKRNAAQRTTDPWLRMPYSRRLALILPRSLWWDWLLTPFGTLAGWIQQQLSWRCLS
jgi:hypothetical protein